MIYYSKGLICPSCRDVVMKMFERLVRDYKLDLSFYEWIGEKTQKHNNNDRELPDEASPALNSKS